MSTSWILHALFISYYLADILSYECLLSLAKCVDGSRLKGGSLCYGTSLC